MNRWEFPRSLIGGAQTLTAHHQGLPPRLRGNRNLDNGRRRLRRRPSHRRGHEGHSARSLRRLRRHALGGLGSTVLVDVEHSVRLLVHRRTARRQPHAAHRSSQSPQDPSEELPRPRRHRPDRRDRRRPRIHPRQRLGRTRPGDRLHIPASRPESGRTPQRQRRRPPPHRGRRRHARARQGQQGPPNPHRHRPARRHRRLSPNTGEPLSPVAPTCRRWRGAEQFLPQRCPLRRSRWRAHDPRDAAVPGLAGHQEGRDQR